MVIVGLSRQYQTKNVPDPNPDIKYPGLFSGLSVCCAKRLRNAEFLPYRLDTYSGRQLANG